MADFADPFRLRVLKALTVSLRTITVANGYGHDLATSVFRGRTIFGDSDPLPMLSILQPPAPLDQVQSTVAIRTGPWELLIQGFVDDDDDNPTDPAELLLADVYKHLAKEAVRVAANGRSRDVLGMGGGMGKANEINTLHMGFGVVRPPDEFVSAKAYFWLPITLHVTEDLNNPFA